MQPLLAQLWGFWRGAGTLGMPWSPSTVSSCSCQAHQVSWHTELQPGTQVSVKNKALLSRGFPPNPNKMTPNLSA